MFHIGILLSIRDTYCKAYNSYLKDAQLCSMVFYSSRVIWINKYLVSSSIICDWKNISGILLNYVNYISKPKNYIIYKNCHRLQLYCKCGKNILISISCIVNKNVYCDWKKKYTVVWKVLIKTLECQLYNVFDIKI